MWASIFIDILGREEIGQKKTHISPRLKPCHNVIVKVASRTTTET